MLRSTHRLTRAVGSLNSCLYGSVAKSCQKPKFWKTAAVPVVSSYRSFASFQDQTYLPHPTESFINGTNAHVLEELYFQWKEDKASVDPKFADFFANLDQDVPPGQRAASTARLSRFAQHGSLNSEDLQKAIDVFKLIRSYRVLGHFLADLDPLKLNNPSFNKVQEDYKRELDPSTFGFTEADLDKEFFIGNELPGGKPYLQLRTIIQLLKSIYCGKIGVQFMHVHDPAIKLWVQQELEKLYVSTVTDQEKRVIYERVVEAESFEEFCEKKFQNTKRFGLNGGESLIPGMHALVEQSAKYNIENLVFGMPHRGRLNVMTNIMGKPLKEIFSEFKIDDALAGTVQGSGDVKYHLGTSRDRDIGGKTIHLSLAANPSHLEAVDPVVCGKTRAKQVVDSKGRTDFNKAMGVLVHGDAAFAGQGVVAETIELSGLYDFSTGGTIHVIVNNQIGFTTVPKYARTSPYPSEVAKATGAPIFHVNGDDPEAVSAVFKLAVDFRQKFHTDTVIDIFCYRRFGHNELDEPRFTQPKMYQAIATHPSLMTLYGQQLAKTGSLSESEQQAIQQQVNERLNAGYQARLEHKSLMGDWLECHWKGFVTSREGKAEFYPTGVDLDTIRHILRKLIEVPEGFEVHPKIKNFRFPPIRKMLETDKGVDWATGEALAFGSLLLDKYEVRLSGQDCERGTFSQRHAVLYCQKTEKTWEALEHLSQEQGFFNVINSSLSENAVLGFEHGYSLVNPNCLAVWEAQFGDFVNGAQVIIDQFISSGEQKWLRMSGLTMFLPHGFEGQGPEHSSGRVERFLQLADDHPDVFPTNVDQAALEINLQVANCSTPANFFHLLRRQLLRNFRKPLIVMTPKSLLKSNFCVSDLTEFGPDSSFQRLIPEIHEILPGDQIRKVLLCTGRVYYDLAQEREARAKQGGKNDVAILRVEQIAPFPFDLVQQEVSKYPNAQVVWVQEEPMNQGAWYYVAPRIETALNKRIRPTYVGRVPSAAPATGLMARHQQELRKFLDAAFA